ncbi:uncharacterized protein LOC114447987 isoform X2 [Parambassis ranga]|uniref:Uncharacterized protein LOC114447987 isoform X2 n=1 Tax=Parambassis ranga TaxID=210632 RepID=A0A6P7JTY4_9TELE|nr:uncharacterized protein LOC114447987 isoform X2 [Parambassis ranga]
MTQQFSSSLALSLLVFVTCSEAALTVKVGDQVVLKPDPVPAGDIKDITWKHNEDIVLDWDKGAGITYYRHFKGRCELNTKTAELKILSLTLEDSGSYKAEVNSVVQSPTELLVLASVPKPTVSETCDPQEDYCTLSCDGNTTGTGPVTYTWMSGGTEVSSTKDYILTKDAKEPSFHCVLNNTVSSQSSEKFHNRFIGNYQKLWLLVLVPILLFVLGIGFYKWKTRTKTWGPVTPEETEVLHRNGTANNPEPLEVQVHSSESQTPAPTQETSNEADLTEQLEDQGPAEVDPAPPVAQGSGQDDAERLDVSEDPKGSTQDQPASVFSEQAGEAESSVTSSADRESSGGDVQTAPPSDACDNPETPAVMPSSEGAPGVEEPTAEEEDSS